MLLTLKEYIFSYLKLKIKINQYFETKQILI